MPISIPNPQYLSDYVTLMAVAAGTAHHQLANNATQPLSLSEFRFKVNLAGALEFTSETEVKLNYRVVSLTQKIGIKYQESWGLEIECTIIPL